MVTVEEVLPAPGDTELSASQPKALKKGTQGTWNSRRDVRLLRGQQIVSILDDGKWIDFSLFLYVHITIYKHFGDTSLEIYKNHQPKPAHSIERYETSCFSSSQPHNK